MNEREIRIPASRSFDPTRLVMALLVFVPISIGLHLAHQDPVWVFATSCLAIVPLAKSMGLATEALSAKAGPSVGGLLNATFGNAVELILALLALNAGLVDRKSTRLNSSHRT